jgi:hypothetical protein
VAATAVSAAMPATAIPAAAIPAAAIPAAVAAASAAEITAAAPLKAFRHGALTTAHTTGLPLAGVGDGRKHDSAGDQGERARAHDEQVS